MKLGVYYGTIKSTIINCPHNYLIPCHCIFRVNSTYVLYLAYTVLKIFAVLHNSAFELPHYVTPIELASFSHAEVRLWRRLFQKVTLQNVFIAHRKSATLANT